MGGTNVTSSSMGMFGVSLTFHQGLEAFMLIGMVFYHSLGTVGFMMSVTSMDIVMVALLLLGLVVVGMGVMYAIFEVVVRNELKVTRWGFGDKGYFGYLHDAHG